MRVSPSGLGSLVIAFALVNLLVLLEVAERLSLKNDLEIAREIQKAMLPPGRFRAPGADVAGFSRPANTVGGDFYEILPLGDGRLVTAVGDVAGKGSPAALLMALLLAMMRTLADERLEPAALMARLNVQVCRQAPGSRFITVFYSVLDLTTGELTYVNAGHTPPLLLRPNGDVERLQDGGVALGMFDGSLFETGRVLLRPVDLLAMYSDGITEAENPRACPSTNTASRPCIDGRTPEQRRGGLCRCRARGRAAHGGHAPRGRPDIAVTSAFHRPGRGRCLIPAVCERSEWPSSFF